MKKIFILAALFLSQRLSASAFHSLELNSTGTWSAEKSGGGTKNSLQFSAGGKLKFTHTEFSAFVTLPKTKTETLKKISSAEEFFGAFNDIRFGGSAVFFEKKVPLTIKGGMLNFSRSVSRLKTPAPAAMSYTTSKSFSWTPGLHSTIPALSSAVKPLGIFCSANFKKTGLPLTVCGFATEEGNAFFSTLCRITLSPHSFLDISFNGGRFFLENNSALLKKNGLSFNGGFYFAGSFEAGFQSPHFKSSLFATIHESPYGAAGCTINSKSRIAFGPFVVNANFFAIPTSSKSPKEVPLIAAGSALTKTVEQHEINPQFLFFVKNFSCRAGFSASKTWKIAGTSDVATLNLLRLNAGLSAENAKTSAKINFAASNILLSENPPDKSLIPGKYYALSLSASNVFEKLRASVSFSFKHYPPVTQNSAEKQTASFTSNLSFGKAKRLYFSAGIDSTFSDGEFSKLGGTVSAAYKAKFKKVSISLKAAAKISVGL